MKAATAKKLTLAPAKSPRAPAWETDLINKAKGLEKRVAELEAVCKPSAIFQLSYSSQGQLEYGAIEVPVGGIRMLANYNVTILFRKPDTYLFSYPVFSCPVWEAVLVGSPGNSFTTTAPVSCRTFAIGIITNGATPASAKHGDVVTMKLKVTSQTDPNFKAEFIQEFHVE